MDKKPTRWIAFLGGKNLLFTLVVLLLTGCTIFVFHQLNFLFQPLGVILQTIIGPIILALVLYYLFNPLINWLEKKQVKRIYSISGLFIIIAALVTLGIILVWPVIQKQLETLVTDFPKYTREINHLVAGLFRNSPVEEPVKETLESIERWLSTISESIGDYLEGFLQGASSVVSTITGFILVIATAPIITFFLLKDDRKFFGYLIKIVPPRFRDDMRAVGHLMNNQVGAYLKGQIIVCITIGLLTFLGFVVIGMPYAGSLSLVTGITAFVPYIGPFAAFIPALIIALLHSFGMVVKMVIIWVIVQMLNGHLIEPAVMGKHLVVHPITIVFVLLAMGNIMGIFGLIFAVPIYAILKVLMVYLFRKWKQRYNKFYGEEGTYEETEFREDDY